MKILFVVEQYVDEGGRYYREFFRHLRGRGVSVVVVNLCESEAFRNDLQEFLVGYHGLGLTGSYYRGVPSLRRIFRLEEPSVIQAIETIPTFYCALAMLPFPRLFPPLVYGRRHGPTLGWVQKVMDQIAFAVSSKVIAVSDSMAEVAKAEHPSGKEKVTSIFSGVSLEAGGAPSEEEENALATLREDRADYTVLLLARLREIKGHRVALQAAERLSKAHDGVRFLFVGDGPDREALEREVADRGLTDKVVFTGHVERVGEVMDLADVMIVPSFADAFPKTAVEAFGARLPVIASSVGGLNDLITDRETGLLVPPGDGEALAKAIETLMSDRKLAESVARSARRVYEETLTPEAMVSAYYRVYQDLVGEG